jgi:hypothetical protein
MTKIYKVTGFGDDDATTLLRVMQPAFRGPIAYIGPVNYGYRLDMIGKKGF